MNGQNQEHNNAFTADALERLGWNIKRVWSTDWFKNPVTTLQPIIRELNRLKSSVKNDAESEFKEIKAIIYNTDKQAASLDKYAYNGLNLREKLIKFDREVIRKEFPNTPENKRVIRKEMLEVLLKHKPISRAEFLEKIPSYIRIGTKGAEGKYLEDIFYIINASLEEVSAKTEKGAELN